MACSTIGKTLNTEIFSTSENEDHYRETSILFSNKEWY